MWENAAVSFSGTGCLPHASDFRPGRPHTEAFRAGGISREAGEDRAHKQQLLKFFCVSSAERYPLWDGRKTSASLPVAPGIWRAQTEDAAEGVGGKTRGPGRCRRGRADSPVLGGLCGGYPGSVPLSFPNSRARGRNGIFEKSH